MLSDNSQIIDSFLKYIKFEKMYSRETLRAYQNDLIHYDQMIVQYYIYLDLLLVNMI